jgi:hypothetical protein
MSLEDVLRIAHQQPVFIRVDQFHDILLKAAKYTHEGVYHSGNPGTPGTPGTPLVMQCCGCRYPIIIHGDKAPLVTNRMHRETQQKMWCGTRTKL